MKYKSGYKHVLYEDEWLQTSFHPSKPIKTKFIVLETNGVLTLYKGYAWDGATFVADRKTNMRGSAGHDALYQLMRMGLLSSNNWRIADECFARWLLQDGAWSVTVRLDMVGLAMARGRAALHSNRRKIKVAP